MNFITSFARRCTKCLQFMDENEEKSQCRKCNLYFHYKCLNGSSNLGDFICSRCKSVRFSPVISEASD